MFEIALYQPEIPPNTGNIIRLCANTGCKLHLIHPLGFNPNDKDLRRAGLDYHQWTSLYHHENYEKFLAAVAGKRILGFSTHGKKLYADHAYETNEVLLFGPETRGLPKDILASLNPHVYKVPMVGQSRSLNLSNAVAIVTYEAWRQLNFQGFTPI